MNNKYEYDVAFSFLKEDEELAFQINDFIQDRVKTFIYSKQQEKIAGTDGEEIFNRVFGAEARIVVVFYRENWGKTPWTRIEETAIRNRAYENGYDFAIFIPLDKPPNVPKWLPKTQIWIGLDRWGIEGAASVVEARVQQTGGAPHEETAVEKAKRIEREIAAEEDRKSFLESERGVKTANEEKATLFDRLDRLSQEVTADTKGIAFKKERNEYSLILYAYGFSLNVSWLLWFANTLKDSSLNVTLWKGIVSLNSFRVRIPSITIDPEQLKEMKFNFDRNATGELGWRLSNGEKRFFSSGQLAQECMKMFLDKVRDGKFGDLENI